MKTKLSFYLLLIAFTLSLSSCYNVYIPNMHNASLIKEAEELKVTANPANLQVAYSPVENFLVVGNGFYKNNNSLDGDLDFNYRARRFFAEGGLGLYQPFGDEGVFEIIGGGGVGSVEFGDNFNPKSAEFRFKANNNKFFVQPSIGYVDKNIEIGFSLRAVGLQFHSIEEDSFPLSELEFFQLHRLDEAMFFFLEPAITVRAGIEWVKGHFQLMYVNNLTGVPVHHKVIAANLGVTFNLAPRYKKDKTPEQ
ncbi:MAG: hypothetical protein WD077_11730 [Bacteroidia bacterium]